mmetsp:Transcript_88711/g.230233  ORF Transcript_88711/g.230233 Transcript_88711/m.230233 type:complete len:244 (+) Transcript_88711:244-975(+)
MLAGVSRTRGPVPSAGGASVLAEPLRIGRPAPSAGGASATARVSRTGAAVSFAEGSVNIDVATATLLAMLRAASFSIFSFNAALSLSCSCLFLSSSSSTIASSHAFLSARNASRNSWRRRFASSSASRLSLSASIALRKSPNCRAAYVVWMASRTSPVAAQARTTSRSGPLSSTPTETSGGHSVTAVPLSASTSSPTCSPATAAQELGTTSATRPSPRSRRPNRPGGASSSQATGTAVITKCR